MHCVAVHRLSRPRQRKQDFRCIAEVIVTASALLRPFLASLDVRDGDESASVPREGIQLLRIPIRKSNRALIVAAPALPIAIQQSCVSAWPIQRFARSMLVG